MAEIDEYTIVPAAPGFDVLYYAPTVPDAPDGGEDYYTRPVVAWAILSDESGFVRAFPVAALGNEHMSADLAVMIPSGEIVCGDMEWDSLRAWLDFCKENAGKTEPEPPQKQAPVLALDAFRNKLRGP
jgi:hypothetical protein